MTITAIKQQVKNPDRVSVFVDGKYSFSLTYGQILDEGVKNGLELDETRLKVFKKLSQEGKLKARAMEWLMGRPHSVREFQDYMRRKQAEPELVTAWIEEFTEKRYLSDRAFAEWFIEQRRDFRQRSTRAISAELGAKGVDREIIAELLADSADDEQAALRQLIDKKRRSTRYRDPEKLLAYLVRQGFSYSLVKAALAEGDE